MCVIYICKSFHIAIVDWNCSANGWCRHLHGIYSLSQFLRYVYLNKGLISSEPFDRFSAMHFNKYFIGDELWSAPVVLIVIGAIVFIIAFLGCCGAIKESSCMVLTVSICESESILSHCQYSNVLKTL